MRLRRKIDSYLVEWKNSSLKKPLIVKGARQIGKTDAIRNFGQNNYKSYIEINFLLQPEFKTIFDHGFTVDAIIKNITLVDAHLEFIPNDTLIFFDELQAMSNCATSLKSFNSDGRYDVICSGSLMGLNYNEIESNSVGNKIDYEMHSLDFEEFLWAKGYKDEQIEDLYECMKETKPLSNTQYDVMLKNFRDYMVVGGMPEIVKTFIENKTFNNILDMQKQILLDYEEDITKYAGGLDKTKILNAYRKVTTFLGNDNKKFQITKIASGARTREYLGVVDWLAASGIINVSYHLDSVSLPLKGNCNLDNYRVYYGDTGLLIATLDEESQDDLRKNKNFNTYKGAIYENIVSDMLVKEGYDLYFYRDDPNRVEMDFFIRDQDSLIPLEVKAEDNATKSLNALIDNKTKYKDVKYGIKLGNKNIGFNGKFYTFPYFLGFLLKRYLKEKDDK